MVNKGEQVVTYGWQNESSESSHSYLLPIILKILKDKNPKSILDLGCGNGSLTRSIHDNGYNIMGCDADLDGIKIAKQFKDITFHHLGVYDDASLLKVKDLECILTAEVVEHLYLPSALPKFAHRLLANDGFLIITTPYHGYIKNLIISLTNKWDQHLDPFWDGGHIKLWSKKTLIKLLNENGFEVEKFYGVGRLPYLWKSMVIVAKKVN